ncbi:hypothetical protein Godav_024476 [Gossypium davidsonii]|uniref:Uncharacterized protein n=2 Tax=Gossypium TaxID=3633 RepID=A0A7J8TAT7_GOSDV|nr:hypothetical protein [Gossypium davidsonii]MBA0671354.1 hypothetical protein [Gossypium klotzschianum]
MCRNPFEEVFLSRLITLINRGFLLSMRNSLCFVSVAEEWGIISKNVKC